MTSIPSRHRRVWTDEEDHKLMFFWGATPLPTIATKLNRTAWAVAQRARALKLGPFSRGDGLSMRAFCEHSGFSDMKVWAAVEALGLLLRRMPTSDPEHRSPRRAYLISEEQQEKLLEHMLEHEVYFKNKPGSGKTEKGVWGVGKKPEACLDCRRTDKPHFARGKCKYCYTRPYKEATRAKLKATAAGYNKNPG